MLRVPHVLAVTAAALSVLSPFAAARAQDDAPTESPTPAPVPAESPEPEITFHPGFGGERRLTRALSRFGGHLAAFSPGGATSGTGPLWVGVSLLYRLQPPAKRTLFQTDVYLDAIGTQGRTVFSTATTDYRDGRLFTGVGLPQRMHLYAFKGAASLYLGAGGGLYHLQTLEIREPRDDFDFDDDNRPGRRTDTTAWALRGGYKLFGGIQFRRGLYAEAAWHDAGAVNGVAFRGASLAIGYRL